MYSVVCYSPVSVSNASRNAVRLYRFSSFEVDLSKRELRKYGIRIRVERKPWHLLIALLEKAGEVVSRDQLRAALWGPHVFVDFEHGLNVAVKKLRAALCDSPEKPIYIQTIASEGYRFIAAVDSVPEVSENISDSNSGQWAEQTSIPFDTQLHRLLGRADTTPVHIAAPSKIYRFLGLELILLLAMLGFRAHRPIKHGTAARDWVLVSQFDNRTSDPGIDDIASYTLKVELSDSPLVRVVPHERLVEVLQMMKRSADTRVDAAVGREICLRDGTIKALIAGRIENLGAQYLVSVLVVDPITDIPIKGFTEEASDKVGVLHALRQLSNKVREQVRGGASFHSQ
jgi:eukaryotic-like serine/threonine-protein kinase